VLEEFAPEYGLTVHETSIASIQGQAVLERFHPPLPPFVIVDGELFSSGRLPRKKLRKHLERMKAVV
jgi:Mg2+/citrate symporter